MKAKYFLLIVTLLAPLGVQAQKLTVESMKMAGNDISASQYRVNDLNGQLCALVRVQLATPGATFAGNVIGTPQFKEGEYWVYVTAGTKELEVKHKSFVPCHVTFSDYGIQPLQGLTTYVLTLLMPQGGAAPVQKQKLTIKYSPANATVLIDNKLYKGNGLVEATLSVGTHNYIIAADGYETVEGMAKLTSNAPRIINEMLVALSGTQGTVVVQQANQAVEEAPQQPVDKPTIETFTVNGVSFNMVRVDGGTFTMGATEEQGSDAYDWDAHQVTLSTYSIGEMEVTQALWQAVMGSNPSKFKGDNLPVEQVSWDDCQTFINKLNQLTGKHFRLPTEAEWEYAARGGNKSQGYKYSGSNSIDDVAWYGSNSDGKTHPVKTKQANELGLYDMSGNVREWCQDWYGSYSSSSQLNATRAASGSSRVRRGGSWGSTAGFCRVSIRIYYAPSTHSNDLGLRLAL